VTTDNHFPYRIYAAQQDNSTIRIAHRTDGYSINEDDWESTAGGESAHIAVDPLDNDIVYGGSYGGFLTRLDHKTDFNRVINVWPDNPIGYGAEGMKYRFQWNFPIFFSKHNPKKLYAASNHLHVTTDEGQSWQIISPDLTRNDSTKLVSSGGPITKDNTGVEYYCTIFAAAESPLKEGLIWVGSDDGLIHYTDDGGNSWNNVTPKNIPKWLMINSIEPSPFDEASCYIAGTSYKTGDFTPYLFKTNDFGKTWLNISNGINKEHFTRVLRADPTENGVLYTGTESQMYISFNDGLKWESLQLNLPIVPITDLTIKNNNLIAATQGRGLWMIDDLSVIKENQKLEKIHDFHLYKPADAFRMKGGQNKKVKGAGMNHPGGVMCYFYLREYDEEKDSISLIYKTISGDTIRKFSNFDKEDGKLKLKKGANLFTWNMKHENAKKFDGMILWWSSLSGATILPGNYEVSLVVNGKSATQEFKVLVDPRVEYTGEQLKQKYDFMNEVNAKTTEAHQTIENIRELKKQMNAVKEKHNIESIKEKIAEIDSSLTLVENELYQTKAKSSQDVLNYPIKLTNKLAHLNSLIDISDAPPTDQMIEVKEELVTKIDEQLLKYKEINQKDIKALNELIKVEIMEFIKLSPAKE
jgi:hypothetical protein